MPFRSILVGSNAPALLMLCTITVFFTPNGTAADVELFSGGWQNAQKSEMWAIRYGNFAGNGPDIFGLWGELTPGSPHEHAEAQRLGFLGADFTYSAELSVSATVEAHLQFRISDQGRYGVRIRPESMILYRFLRVDENCQKNGSPPAISHCPAWPDHDDPIFNPIITCTFGQADCSCPAPNVSTLHKVSISATGVLFKVTLDGRQCMVTEDRAAGKELLVGRFGIYAYGERGSLPRAHFRDVRADTDPTALSNFALLYSTAGYEASETKRALVRTLNDLSAEMLDAGHSIFTVSKNGQIVQSGPLVPLHEPGSSRLAKTFGMQLLEADFSQIKDAGRYTLRAEMATITGARVLTSASFEIRERLVSVNLLRGMTLMNATARRAADEDMRRNWCFEIASGGCSNDPRSGQMWSVAEDGAFFADRSDDQHGAVLRRVFNLDNGPFASGPHDFHYVGEITIISGCDAQLQFGVTETERWGVTLQAGAAGGCQHGGGPGAVRLNYEDTFGMQTLTANLFPEAHPFVAGHPYDVDITVAQGRVTVLVDGGVVHLDNIPVPPLPLGFALKAWASTVRFRRVQAWDASVDLRRSAESDLGMPSDGTRIPFYRALDSSGEAISVPCQFWYGALSAPNALDSQEKTNACYPFFSQLSGFHDCNNYIGEATSHGTFLAALMDVWTSRASEFSQEERESLRRAIITNALYIEELYLEGDATGEFAHSEMGRGGVDTNLGPHQTLNALYGESAFADRGVKIDPRLARLACSRSVQSAQWLLDRRLLDDSTQASIIYAHIARCTAREGMPWSDLYGEWAMKAAAEVLVRLSAFDGVATSGRDTARIFPWFEGVYEVARDHPEFLTVERRGQLAEIAQLLVDHLTKDHFCDDKAGKRCPKNGFLVLPQASGRDPIPRTNWTHMDSVPLIDRVAGLPYVHFYSIPHFAVTAADAVYLGRLTGRRDLEQLASGGLNWILGLNPGVPASKVASYISDQPWQAASFVYNTPAGSVRTMDGWRTSESSSKGWLAPREVSAASPKHETWWIDPLNIGFFSIVNGHVIWDHQLDYVSSGGTLGPDQRWLNVGWSSGETFLLDDGIFIKAALLLEDWLLPRAGEQSNPYDVEKLAFFDSTQVDRLSADWSFDNPDGASYAQAGREATNFCVQKGFLGGRFTGHYLGERIGLLCTPTRGSFFDITQSEIRSTGWDFSDINTTNWAQVARAATAICNARGFVGGFFTGHQLNGFHGLDCLKADVASWFDATDMDLRNSGGWFADIDSVAWAQAARAATNICLARGASGGFFTGHQLDGKHGIVCLSQ